MCYPDLKFEPRPSGGVKEFEYCTPRSTKFLNFDNHSARKPRSHAGRHLDLARINGIRIIGSLKDSCD